MAAWSDDELEAIGSADELQVASVRKDGSLRPYATIWGVRCGDELYVRSAYGPENPWFARASRAGAGRVRAGDLEVDVAFERAGDDVQDAVDEAYRSKYGRYGAKLVDTVAGEHVHGVTLRVRPRN